MSNEKLNADALRQKLDRLRDASRVRARRRRVTGEVIVFLCLLLFLSLSSFAAVMLWEELQAPFYVAVLIAVLAASVQQVLGLAMKHGRFRRRSEHRSRLWTITLISSLALVILAG